MTPAAVLAGSAPGVPAASAAGASAPLPGSVAALFKDRCEMCHAADGSGSTQMGKMLKAQNLRAPEIKAQKDAALAAVIADGKGNMPAQKSSLTSAQIGQLVAYIRALQKVR